LGKQESKGASERARETRVFLAMARVAADRTISGLAKRLSGCVLSVPGSVPQGMFAGRLSVYFLYAIFEVFPRGTGTERWEIAR